MDEEWKSALQGETRRELEQAQPERVGGWLLYFCIASIFLSPLASMNAIAKAFNPFWLACYIGGLIFSISAGIATLLRSESAFTLVRLDFTSKALYGLAQIGWALHLRALNQPTTLIESEFSRAAGSLLAVIIWFWYFKVSVRVKRTFGRNI